jgi:hypothetical protein
VTEVIARQRQSRRRSAGVIWESRENGERFLLDARRKLSDPKPNSNMVNCEVL